MGWLDLRDVTFASPEWLQALWGLVALPLVYWIRRAASKVSVPHLPIWETVFASRRRRRSLWRTVLSILLQAVVISAVIVLLAGPERERLVPGRGGTVVVLDQSLGTRALGSDGRSLAEGVRARGEELLVESVPFGFTSLAFLRGRLEPRSLASVHLEDLRRGLADPGVPQGDRPSRELLGLAGLVSEATRVAFVTPFEPPEAQELRAAGVALIKSGDGLPQAGIIGVQRRGNTLEATVVGAGTGRTIQFGDESAVLESVELGELGPEGASVRFGIPSGDVVRPWLKLVPPDGFPDDDEVPLVLGGLQRVRVLVVAASATPWLDAWLRASPSVDVARSNRVEPSVFRPLVNSYDVTILVDFDSGLPLPPGRFLLLGAGAPELPVVLDERTRVPSEAVRIQRNDSLVRGLDLGRWRVDRVGPTRALPGLDVVVEGTVGPLLARGGTGAIRFVFLAVPPDATASTLPLLTAFPLFLESAVQELSGVGYPDGPVVLPAGGRVVLNPGERPELWTEEGHPMPPLEAYPDGTGFRLPHRPGRYSVGGGGDNARRIALAWLDHPGRPGPPLAVGDPLPTFPERRRTESLRSWVGGLLLFLLLLEWWTWHLWLTE